MIYMVDTSISRYSSIESIKSNYLKYEKYLKYCTNIGAVKSIERTKISK